MDEHPAPAERERFLEGVARFNAGEHFAAHEAWEDLWRNATDAEWRRCLQGLIQVAAGYHQLRVRGRPESAARLLARGLSKLAQLPDGYAGLDLGRFRDEVAAALAAPRAAPVATLVHTSRGA